MISKVRDKVMKFLEETIEAEAIKVIRVSKIDGGWIAEAEVIEKNQQLASVRAEYRVFEKEHYIVKLNSALDVYSYKRASNNEEWPEDSNYDF